MTHTIVLSPQTVRPLQELHDVLALLALAPDLREPLTTESRLRQAIEIMLWLADRLGIDPEWVDRLRLVLANEHVFRIVLAIAQYVSSILDENFDEAEAARLKFSQASIDGQTFLQWLPLVLELISLWQRLRGR